MEKHCVLDSLEEREEYGPERCVSEWPPCEDCPYYSGDGDIEPLSFAPVSAVPVAGFVEVGEEPIGNFLRFPDGWYYQEDGKPMERICPAEGRPYPGHFVRRDGCWYYRRDEGEPWEYVGPVDGRAVIL